MRLDKLLSDHGIGTRKEIKKLLSKQGALIDGALIKDPSYQIQSDQIVEFNGDVISQDPYVYYLFHKPAGCVCANEDPMHPTIFSYIPNPKNLLFSVGRLDIDTEGLLLVTNDGKLSHALLSPRHHVDKIYYARLDGPLTKDHIQKFAEGIDIGDEKLCMPAKLQITSDTDTEAYITIQEGRYHQVKRMFASIGRNVLYLRRESMGPLILDPTLEKGTYRALTDEEITNLRKYAE